MFMYTIYMFKNKINSKAYIGLTNNLRRRINEHRCHKKKTKFSYAIRKYGLDNFEMEILRSRIQTKEQASVLEKMYIKRYNSINVGYNLTEGGEVGSGRRGENAPSSKITEEQAKYILLSDEYSSKLAREMGISHDIIVKIRLGITWKHLGIIPKCSKNGNYRLSKDQAIDILQCDATNDDMTKKYNVTPDVISKIRRGVTWKHLDRENVPIYKKKGYLTDIQRTEILKQSEKSAAKLGKEYGVTRHAIWQLRSHQRL